MDVGGAQLHVIAFENYVSVSSQNIWLYLMNIYNLSRVTHHISRITDIQTLVRICKLVKYLFKMSYKTVSHKYNIKKYSNSNERFYSL